MAKYLELTRELLKDKTKEEVVETCIGFMVMIQAPRQHLMQLLVEAAKEGMAEGALTDTLIPVQNAVELVDVIEERINKEIMESN